MPLSVLRATVLTAVTAVTALALTACAQTSEEPPAAAPSTQEATATEEPAAKLSGTLTVFAAASLTDTFTELGDRFMATHPDLTVTFNFDGSSGLAAQITSGAPADVFAVDAVDGTLLDAGLVLDVDARCPDHVRHGVLLFGRVQPGRDGRC